MERHSDGEEDGDVDTVNDHKTGSYFTPSSNFRSKTQRKKDRKASHLDADFSTADQRTKGRCSWVACESKEFWNSSSNSWFERVEDQVVASAIADTLKVNPLPHIAATSIARAGDGC